jgi:hypothetical protein
MFKEVFVPATITIVLSLIPQQSQRYQTVGDWMWHGDRLDIRISQEVGAKHPEYLALLSVHELVEALLCHQDGVSTSTVDAFDLAYRGEGEPGDNPLAPYHREHKIATQVERALAAGLKVKWSDYEQALDEAAARAKIPAKGATK